MASLRRSSALQLSPGQAEYVLNSLLNDHQITRWQVQGALTKMNREIQELEVRLATLRAGANGHAKRPPAHGPVNGEAQTAKAGNTAARRRKPRTISPEAHASHVLQGQYIYFMRQIPEGKRDRFKKIAKDSGRETAIAEMKKAIKQ
jgi:hypothetical protein